MKKSCEMAQINIKARAQEACKAANGELLKIQDNFNKKISIMKGGAMGNPCLISAEYKYEL